MPGVGADQMIEIYGKNQAVLSSVLYSFNDNRDSTDWNGFNALSTTNARSIQNTVEVQIPLFDLGLLSLKLISLIERSGSPSAKVFIAEKGNIKMANRRAVSFRFMVVPNTVNLPDYKGVFTLFESIFYALIWCHLLKL